MQIATKFSIMITQQAEGEKNGIHGDIPPYIYIHIYIYVFIYLFTVFHKLGTLVYIIIFYICYAFLDI